MHSCSVDMLPFVVITVLALFGCTTKSTLTDCSATSDTCICVWNLRIFGRRINNGIYRIVDSTKTGIQRDWVNDDINSWSKCSREPQMFWYFDGNGRWFLGDETDINTGTGACFCTSGPGKLDPTQTSCDKGDYYCTDINSFPQTQYNDGTTPDLIDVYWGKCPELKDVCTSIKIIGSSGYDICDGIYDTYPSPNNLDNEMNIYRNRDNDKINRYIYFDQTQFRWVCSQKYDPCSLDYSIVTDTQYNNSYIGDVIYKGKDNDAGTPDWKTITATGQTWSVPQWGTQSDANGIATFECNSVGPTKEPTSTTTTESDSTNDAVSNQPSMAPSTMATVVSSMPSDSTQLSRANSITLIISIAFTMFIMFIVLL